MKDLIKCATQLLLLLLSFSQASKNPSTPQGEPKCVLGFCLPMDYEKLRSPEIEGPIHIDINVEILDILSVDEKEFSISLSMFFSLKWQENRIFPKNNSIVQGMWYPVPLEFLDNLWIPNVYIYNLKSFSSLKVVKSLAGVWIIDGKDVFYNQIAQITFLCPMRFGKYPLDEHICKLRFGSTNFDINQMTFGETAFTYDENNRNTVLDYDVSLKKLREQDRIYNYRGSNYSVTGLEMKLKRNYKKFLYVYYLPSGLLVAVSWIGFLIPAELVLGRLAILITPLLLLINIFNIIISSSPNAEGITAVAAWMLACLFFVLGSLFGYVFILLKNRKWNLFVRKDDGRLTEENEDEKKKNTKKGQADFRSEVYDDVFLLVFPIMFLMFNLIYWPICLY